jgi:hypothetical protein
MKVDNMDEAHDMQGKEKCANGLGVETCGKGTTLKILA